MLGCSRFVAFQLGVCGWVGSEQVWRMVLMEILVFPFTALDISATLLRVQNDKRGVMAEKKNTKSLSQF